MKGKFILNFAPTGLIPTREMSSKVPLNPDEIIDQVIEVAELGVNMVHLHARERETGRPAYDRDIYGQIIKGVRKKYKDLVLCVSTSGRYFFEFEKRSDVLELEGELKPDFGSLTLSSLNFNKQASINPPDIIQDLAKKMLERQIRPEMEVFDLGMVNYSKYLIRKGLLNPPYYFNIILGNIACAQADLLSLGLIVTQLPEGSIWSVGGVGASQLKMNAVSLAAGGGVRVGLEDNIWFDEERTRLASNRELIERILSIAEALGRTPFTHRESRQILGLDSSS